MQKDNTPATTPYWTASTALTIISPQDGGAAAAGRNDIEAAAITAGCGHAVLITGMIKIGISLDGQKTGPLLKKLRA